MTNLTLNVKSVKNENLNELSQKSISSQRRVTSTGPPSVTNVDLNAFKKTRGGRGGVIHTCPPSNPQLTVTNSTLNARPMCSLEEVLGGNLHQVILTPSSS